MYTTIVVGTDGSETATQAVTRAAALAARDLATLLIVSAYRPVDQSRLEAERAEMPDDLSHVVSPTEDVDSILVEAADLARRCGAAKVETRPAHAQAADALLDVAEKSGADLIVVGSQGMEGARRFLLGSVPNRISHHAPCDVLIVKTGQA